MLAAIVMELTIATNFFAGLKIATLLGVLLTVLSMRHTLYHIGREPVLARFKQIRVRDSEARCEQVVHPLVDVTHELVVSKTDEKVDKLYFN